MPTVLIRNISFEVRRFQGYSRWEFYNPFKGLESNVLSLLSVSLAHIGLLCLGLPLRDVNMALLLMTVAFWGGTLLVVSIVFQVRRLLPQCTQY